MYLLGYDIGSSTIKAALYNVETGDVVGIVQYPERDMDMISRRAGWAEQQPEVWWQDFCMATRRLISQCEIHPARIKGIGIGYQMHGLVLVDKDLHVLRPSIIWCDSRAVTIGRQAFNDMGQEHCLMNYLNSPGNFTASKLKWVKDNEPDIYHRIHKILLPGDYIAMKLSGHATTTISGLTEGIFWNFREKQIANDLLEYYDLEGDLLTETVPTFSVQGKVTKAAAEMTGLAPGTPISYRAGDQPNNALALNVLHPGEIAATSGTSGVVYGIVDRPIFDPKSRVNAFSHVNYEDNHDRIGILLCLNGAGIEYSWMKHQVARSGRNYSDMERMVSSVPVGSEGVCVLPFGNGAERIFENKDLNAHIFNLQFNRHSRAHLFRASLEGVAFSFVYGINILKEMGIDVDVIRVGNDNMFRSKVFAMTIATLLGSQIEVVDTTGAIGAARAAGVGVGIFNDLEDALQGVTPHIIHEPGLNFDQCSRAFAHWKSCLGKILHQNTDQRNIPKKLRENIATLKEETKQKSKDLASMALKIDSKKKLLHDFETRLSELLNNVGTNNPAVKKELRNLVKLIQQDKQEVNDWDTFQEHFDILNDDYFKRLQKLHSGLSIVEMKLCTLLKMKLSTKEISTQLNLSVRGVETRRYRLRKKLNLKKGEKLVSYLEKI
ncbi:MAG: FGGY family carbohydrate kinase [Bacteroidota bacterium]